jgi:hypothetical protein
MLIIWKTNSDEIRFPACFEHWERRAELCIASGRLLFRTMTRKCCILKVGFHDYPHSLYCIPYIASDDFLQRVSQSFSGNILPSSLCNLFNQAINHTLCYHRYLGHFILNIIRKVNLLNKITRPVTVNKIRSLWRWYISKKYYVFGHYPSSCLYLKHRPVYFSKHNVSETGFCLDWAQQSRFYLNTETESSLRNVVLKNKQDGALDKDKTLDNVQKHNICTGHGSRAI